MGVAETPTNNKEGTDVGRTCCGRRCTTGKVDGEWQPVKLIDTHFKGWSCMVDHYFLHIDQETDTVYHHQTCQALHDNKRGPIGSLKNANQLIQRDLSSLCVFMLLLHAFGVLFLYFVPVSSNSMQFPSSRCDPIQCNVINAIRCDVMQYHGIQCSIMQSDAV